MSYEYAHVYQLHLALNSFEMGPLFTAVAKKVRTIGRSFRRTTSSVSFLLSVTLRCLVHLGRACAERSKVEGTACVPEAARSKGMPCRSCPVFDYGRLFVQPGLGEDNRSRFFTEEKYFERSQKLPTQKEKNKWCAFY